MNTKTAVLFGATGLIGGHVLKLLIDDPYFDKLIVVTRKEISLKNKKIDLQMIDFSKPNEIEECIHENAVVFSSIGTTRSKVKGNKKTYREIDHDITCKIGEACKIQNVERFLFISTTGAESTSSSFYLKLKGEIENEMANLNLSSLIILRPSLLLGKRNEIRLGETIAQLLTPLFSFMLPSNLKPVKAISVARVMVDLSKSDYSGNNVVGNKEILAKSKI